MNLIAPPKSKVFSWVAKHRKAVAEYFLAVFQLSKLKAILVYQGRNYQSAVTYTGRNAQLSLNLDFIESAAAGTPYAINYIFADAAAAAAGLVARVANALVASADGSNIAGLAAARITDGLSIDNTDSVNWTTDVGFGMDLVAGNVVMPFTVSWDASCTFIVYFNIYDSDEAFVDSADSGYVAGSSYSGTLTVTAPTDGFYRFQIQAVQTPGPGSPTSQTFSGRVTSADAVASNVVALWTDGSNIGLVPCTP